MLPMRSRVNYSLVPLSNDSTILLWAKCHAILIFTSHLDDHLGLDGHLGQYFIPIKSCKTFVPDICECCCA